MPEMSINKATCIEELNALLDLCQTLKDKQDLLNRHSSLTVWPYMLVITSDGICHAFNNRNAKQVSLKTWLRKLRQQKHAFE